MISAARSAACFRAYEDDLGIARDSINRIMFANPAWQDALDGRLTMQAFWYRIGPSLGLDTQEAVDDFRRRYYRDEAVNPEVLQLIQRLEGHYRLAVLSNHPPGLERWLVDWGIHNHFSVVFCSGDEGCAKPDPAAYRSTLDRLGVRPAEAVFIDDTVGHVQAARRLDIHGIVFTDGRQLVRELRKLGCEGLPPSSRSRDGVNQHSSTSASNLET